MQLTDIVKILSAIVSLIERQPFKVYTFKKFNFVVSFPSLTKVF